MIDSFTVIVMIIIRSHGLLYQTVKTCRPIDIEVSLNCSLTNSLRLRVMRCYTNHSINIFNRCFSASKEKDSNLLVHILNIQMD